MSREIDQLTTTDHWDEYWEAISIPAEIERGQASSTDAILDVIDPHMTSIAPLSILEVGGAPGGYLTYFWRRFGHRVCVLDNSPHGVELTRRNFEQLGVPGEVIMGDLFQPRPGSEQFDVVFSLGLIEHFDDTTAVVAAHLSCLKPGGTLIIGGPNFRGVNLSLLRRLSPSMLSWHNINAMDLARWPSFERALGLEVKFRGYIGGFQPGAFWRCERKTLPNRVLARSLTELGRRRGAINRALVRVNSPRWSYYAMGVYGKPATS